MWRTPVLCVTLNGQCFQIFAPHANIDGSFLDVISCNIKRYKKHWVCESRYSRVCNRGGFAFVRFYGSFFGSSCSDTITVEGSRAGC